MLWNPFDDCFPRAEKAPQPEIVDLAAERRKKKKQKNLSLLSFGDEQQEEDVQVWRAMRVWPQTVLLARLLKSRRNSATRVNQPTTMMVR